MILLDTSAWVEYLRRTGSEVNVEVRGLIQEEKPIATTDVVIMELIAGARDHDKRRAVWAMLNRCTMLPVRPMFDYEVAAHLYLRCRDSGFTPANSNDLLVAAVAIGHEIPVLAADHDFDRIALVSSLKLAA